MPRITDAPNGENSSPAGTESLPLTGSKYATLNTIKSWIQTAFNSIFAPIAKGVTNGDTHDHNGGDGAQINHTTLSNIGTNTHAQIDTHIASTSNPHNTSDANLSTTDITTNNSSLTKHGFLPKLSGDSNLYLNGDGEWVTVTAAPGDVYDSDIIFQDITTGNADSDSHGFLLKLSMNTSHFLRADGSWQAPPAGGSVYDSDILFSDITTNNASTSQHGFLPKLSGDSDQYLNGDGEWISSNRVLLATASPSGTGTVSFTSIPATYNRLVVHWIARSTKASVEFEELQVQLNGDATAANYRYSSNYVYGAGTAGNEGGDKPKLDDIPAATALANSCEQGELWINYYADTTFSKQIRYIGSNRRDNSSVHQITINSSIEWENTAAVNRIDFILASGNFVAGSKFALYGEL